MAITASYPTGDVTASLNFFKPPADGSTPYNLIDPPEGTPSNNYGIITHDVLIRDIRGRESEFTLDQDAFQVLQDIPPSSETDFGDEESIQRTYYPEVKQLLLNTVPGSQSVYIFDHTVRRSDPKAPRGPVQRAHIDQTAKSVAQRIRHYFPEDEANKLLQGRYRLINVWRPLNKKPVESLPLAVASTSTVKDEDVVGIEHRYPSGYVGETAGVIPRPDHKWYYLSGMTGSERLLLECFDSESLKDGSGIGGRAPHTAFVHPRTKVDAEGRESIEVRTLVFG